MGNEVRKKSKMRYILYIIVSLVVLYGNVVFFQNMKPQVNEDLKQDNDEVVVSDYGNTNVEVVVSDHGNTEQGQKEEVSTVTKSSDIVVDEGFEKYLTWVGADEVWDCLTAYGAEVETHKKNKTLAVLEVGMHRLKQSREAAQKGLYAYGFEPSPKSFEVIKSTHFRLDPSIKDRIKLFNVAAGDTRTTVDFSSGGGTGDSVGNNNVWEMTRGDPSVKLQNTVQVEVVPLDDIIYESIPSDQDIFLAKIDTQGFEANVFSGLTKSIKASKIEFVLFEFWPKGMDLMAPTEFNVENRCKSAVKILRNFKQAGYKLYTMSIVVHPHAYYFHKKRNEKFKVERERPSKDFMEHCSYYYELESMFPQDDYKMGYWSDILAVAPTAKKLENVKGQRCEQLNDL